MPVRKNNYGKRASKYVRADTLTREAIKRQPPGGPFTNPKPSRPRFLDLDEDAQRAMNRLPYSESIASHGTGDTIPK